MRVYAFWQCGKPSFQRSDRTPRWLYVDANGKSERVSQYILQYDAFKMHYLICGAMHYLT